MCHGTHVEVRGQLLGVSSCLLSHVSWGSTSTLSLGNKLLHPQSPLTSAFLRHFEACSLSSASLMASPLYEIHTRFFAIESAGYNFFFSFFMLASYILMCKMSCFNSWFNFLFSWMTLVFNWFLYVSVKLLYLGWCLPSYSSFYLKYCRHSFVPDSLCTNSPSLWNVFVASKAVPTALPRLLTGMVKRWKFWVIQYNFLAEFNKGKACALLFDSLVGYVSVYDGVQAQRGNATVCSSAQQVAAFGDSWNDC